MSPDRPRALVVLGFTDTGRRLLRHAGTQGADCGLELVLLSIMPTREFQERDSARLAIPKLDLPYTVEAAQEEGERHARRLAKDLLADLDVEWTVDSRVGRTASLVLEAARDHGCEQIHLVGHRNGRWNRYTFDEVMVEVVTEFDGPVTVLMGEELHA